ncbi:MAG: diacylglycerol kinase family lipid kinase [Eubacterium sp.]|nr:diacylglycerol kinase family lipid kinase [Eubacterium sp.]
MSQKNMIFIVNPKAGKNQLKSKMIEVVDEFSRAGYHVEVYTTKSAEDAENHIYEVGDLHDLIVISGGDGSLDNAVTGVMRLAERTNKVPPLGYIPCGSTNDYAKSLCISLKPEVAARQIMNGFSCPVDVGRLGDRYFIYVAAFGLFTEVSYATPRNLKARLGHAAYIIEGAKSLTSVQTFRLKASFDGRTIKGEFIYGQVTNSRSVGGFRAVGLRDMSFHDGEFECVFIRKPRNPMELERILQAVLTNKKIGDYIIYERAKCVKVEGVEPIPWTVDGEYAGDYKQAKVEDLHNAVTLVLGDLTTYGDPESETLVPAGVKKAPLFSR